MTTTVIVQAHCDLNTEVVIELEESNRSTQRTTIYDGEEHVVNVHGSRVIKVTERARRGVPQASVPSVERVAGEEPSVGEEEPIVEPAPVEDALDATDTDPNA